MENYKYIGTMQAEDLWLYTEEALLDTGEVVDIVRMHGTIDDAAKDKQPSDYDQDWCDEFNEYFLACYLNEDEDKVYDLFKIVQTDRKGNEINVGDNVHWFDPDRANADDERVWEVWEVRGEIILIGDSYSEAEVYPNELEVIQD